MSKKEKLQKLQVLIISNIPITQHLLKGSCTDDEDDVADIILGLEGNSAAFRLSGDQGMIANSFEVKLSWTEKHAYHMKVKPRKLLRKKAKELIKLAADRTWGEHVETEYGFKQDEKLYSRAREQLLEAILRCVVSQRVREIFKESSDGL